MDILSLPLRNLYFPSKNKEAPLLVVMHGLGDQMESYKDFPELLLKNEIHTLLFNAPEPYFMGWKWYDLDGNQEIGLNKSRILIEESISLIYDTLQIPKDKIFLSGFSQGGVVSLYTGLRSQEAYAGLICLSGYLFGEEKEFTQASRKTPVFMAHGIYDDLIPISMVREHKEYLIEKNYQVLWKEYPIPHTICMEEMEDLREWLRNRIQELQ
ncbi:MAG: alpha/beta hydrolase [Leptonema sp. (in: bacteria)]